MCGRISLFDIDHYFERYAITHPVFRMEEHYNIAPGMWVPVVLRHSPLHVELMRWGLVPPWAKDPNIGYRMINARVETIAEKPAYRRAIRTQRCLVGVNSFMEWLKLKDMKVPYSFSLINEEIFSLAGIWEEWKDAEGRPLKTFSILTCEANELMLPIHDRMPVILRRRDEPHWVDPTIQDPAAIKDLMVPFPAALMRRVRISQLANSAANDTPDILAPQPDDPPVALG